MTLLKKLDLTLEKLLDFFSVVFFMGMVTLVICQVFTRFVTEGSLTWSEELSRYFMAYMVFCAAALVTREKQHIRIENLTSKLTGAPKKVVSTISLLIQIAFLVIVIVGYVQFMPTSTMRTSPTAQIPMSVVYFCIPLSVLFMILYLIRDLVNTWHTQGQKQGGEPQ